MYAVIIGAQRSATTWLYEQLRQHPYVSALNKEGGPEPDWARAGESIARTGLLAAARDSVPGTVVLQKATRWLTTPGTAKHLKCRFPDAKVIMIGRDMTDRAWSHYRYSLYNGVEHLTYRQALAAEAARLQILPPEVLHRYAYTAHSSYPVHLLGGRWIELFAPENLFLARTEELDECQGGVLLSELCEWLGLDPAGLGEPSPTINEGEEFRNLITSDVMECQDALAWKFDQLETEWHALWRENRGIKTPPSEDEGAETREGEQER